MSGTSSTAEKRALRELVEACDSLTRCPECGTHVVNLGTHRCPPDGPEESVDRSERRKRALEDTRDDSTRVAIYRRPSGNTYAYHELDDDETYCGCGSYTKSERREILTRGEAKARGRAPCGNCERLRRIRTGDAV